MFPNFGQLAIFAKDHDLAVQLKFAGLPDTVCIKVIGLAVQFLQASQCTGFRKVVMVAVCCNPAGQHDTVLIEAVQGALYFDHAGLHDAECIKIIVLAGNGLEANG